MIRSRYLPKAPAPRQPPPLDLKAILQMLQRGYPIYYDSEAGRALMRKGLAWPDRGTAWRITPKGQFLLDGVNPVLTRA